MKVLVTGSNGFIGRHVVARLEQYHDVTGYDWPDNLCELGEASGFDAVVNLAAIGGAGRAARNPAEVMKNNVGATIALRGALRTNEYGNFPRVIHISSFSVYGDCCDGTKPTTEDQPFAPKEIYGASKAAQELCWAGYPGDLAILRLSSVYGAGMRLSDPEATVIAKIANAYSRNEQFPVYEDGQQERDFVHVGDVVDAISILLNRDIVAHRFTCNVCSGKRVTIEKVCQLIGVGYFISNHSRAGDMRVCWGDSRRLEAMLDHTPRELSDHWKELLH